MDHPLLARYLASECSASEADDVRRWIAASAEHQHMFEQFQRVWHVTPVEPAWDTDAAMSRVQQALHGGPSLTLVAPVEAPSAVRITPWAARRWRLAARIAAAIALIAGGILAFRIARSRADAAPAVAMRTIAAPRGQRAVFHLPDGTSVVLGPESRLRYAETFGLEAREVVLAGEAYFEVRHDTRRPFTVRTDALVAVDLGTAFVVRSYAGDTNSSVIVRAGAVELHPAGPAGSDVGRGPVLRPGDRGRIDRDGRAVVERADTTAAFAWTRGELMLAGVPLREAAIQLSRWYDLDVRIASPAIGARRLEASFTDEPVTEVLHLIAASLRLTVERQGRTVTFRAQ